MFYYNMLICFFKINFFRNIITDIPSECRVSNSLDPDQAQRVVRLIGIQTVCKSYQQTILVDNGLSEQIGSCDTAHLQKIVFFSKLLNV